jgi:predicted glycogen debranching enzyme
MNMPDGTGNGGAVSPLEGGPARIAFGQEICGTLDIAERREWLTTNGTGSYASGTVTGMVTRGYHGLLVAATKPPVGRTLMLVKADATFVYRGASYDLFTNRWSGGAVGPSGHTLIERFWLEGTVPAWRYACGDALIEQRIWMEPGANTTYVRFTLAAAREPASVSIKAIIDHRDYHSRTGAGNWGTQYDSVARGMRVTAYRGATPLYLSISKGDVSRADTWLFNFDLARERDRGLQDHEDHFHAITFQATLEPGEDLILVGSTEPTASPDPAALGRRRAHEEGLLRRWAGTRPDGGASAPGWIKQLVLAADQFVIDRKIADTPDGKSVIAGYHWFGDWGRDTMISIPGLTLATGRAEVARSILTTFSKYVSQGMLPNQFPDQGQQPEYNTVDATLWYFEAIRAYHKQTGDDSFLKTIFPVLEDIIDWHRRGTRYEIRLDPADGLIHAGVPGVQLTWMDAKVGDYVVTPRIGKPIEVNALWYNALSSMAEFATRLRRPATDYQSMAADALKGFARFWNRAAGYCFDVLDGPAGAEDRLRPNQIFAVSLPASPLGPEQQRGVVDSCERYLLTTPGLRSLDPRDRDYRGIYFGDQYLRDTSYHQGIVWGWLKGHFIQAHLRVYGDLGRAESLLRPFDDLIRHIGVGSLSEINDGDPPMTPKGCIAQAWSVAEVLRVWSLIDDYKRGRSPR